MDVKSQYLTINPYSRVGRVRPKTLALVIHWTANPGQDAQSVWKFFEDRSDGHLVNGVHDYGSVQYIIGLDGEVLLLMLEHEEAFHCGSSKLDPASGKYYTDLARAKFGQYAIDYKESSPNAVTIGIEHCVTNAEGEMTTATIESSIELAASICKRYALNPETDILLHKEIVGWKDCHRFWINHPDNWTAYKAAVSTALKGL